LDVKLGLETHVVEFAPRLMPRQIDDAESVIVGLERQVTVAENASRIDQLAVRSTQSSLDSLHAELQQMERELEFYRRIVSPGEGKGELQIERFRMSSGPEGDRFTQVLLYIFVYFNSFNTKIGIIFLLIINKNVDIEVSAHDTTR